MSLTKEREMNIQRLGGLILVMAVVGFICGCGENFNLGTTAPKESDIRASFETLMGAELKAAQKSADDREKEGRARNAPIVFRVIISPSTAKYDVRKTDSLVMPYEAVLTYVEKRETLWLDDNGEYSPDPEKTPESKSESDRYGYRDGKWEHTGSSISDKVNKFTEAYERVPKSDKLLFIQMSEKEKKAYLQRKGLD
jgi:hypothetical protein